ncbi:MAG: hypothetical protein ACRDQB_12135 [Thermocrispum sp.]
MSVREFAQHLGVSDRMVSKWEAAGGQIRPRPVTRPRSTRPFVAPNHTCSRSLSP